MFIHQLVENWACGFGRIVFIAESFIVVRWSYATESFDYLIPSVAKKVLKFYNVDEDAYVEV